jgi:hypothetical protein
MLGAAGGHGDLLRLVGGIVDTDAAGGRAQIAVEVVDGKDGDVDGGGGCLGVGTRSSAACKRAPSNAMVLTSPRVLRGEVGSLEAIG